MPPGRPAPGGPPTPAPFRAAPRARWLPILGLAVAMAALLSGCIAQYPQTIFEPHSEYADEAYWLLELIFWPALLVFIVVEGWLVYTIFRYRQRPGQARPEQVHGNTRIEIA